MVEKITVQGIFRWIGTAYKRIRKPIRYTDIAREMKIFYALNIPKASHLTDKELADLIIIDTILDEGLESEFLITDPQKVVGGFMSPATEQEQTDNPGMVVWLGWVEIPRYARFIAPGEHNVTIKAAFKDQDYIARLFDEEHGGVEKRFDYEIVENRPPEDRPAED
jgi:hypothetical protein